jgi:dihydropyrimidinase
MRRFITAHDVEIVALTGRDRLIIDEDDVVTAIAREMAAKMGVTITFRSRESAPEPARTPFEPSPPPVAPQPTEKPTKPWVPAELVGKPLPEVTKAPSGDDTLVLRNGTIVWPGQGTFQADVSIAGGTIAAIQASAPSGSSQDIDVTGKYIFPGAIDPHVHLGIFNSLEKDLANETKAALWGGLTTVGCFRYEKDSYLPKLDATFDAVDRHSFVDVVFHLTISSREHLEEIPRYVEEYGLRSFKIYMSGVPGIIPDVDDGFMTRVYEKLLSTGEHCTVCIHAENPSLVRWATEEIQAKNGKRTSVQEWSETHPPLAEEEAIRRASLLTKDLTGISTYFVHVSTQGGIEAVSQIKCGIDNVFAETTSPYLLFSIEDVTGNVPKWLPPLRSVESTEALWRHLERGKIDTLGTDSVPMSPAVKGLEKSVWDAMPNAPLMEHHLPAILTEGVSRRNIAMHKLIDLMTRRPAEIFGIYPRKGSLFPGTDADLVVVDLERRATVEKKNIRSGAAFSLFEGKELTGWPDTVIKGGKLVIREGTWVGSQATGRVLHRTR